MHASSRDYYYFLSCIVAFAALGAVMFLGMLQGMRTFKSLPAAPLTGTYCIDEKFKFLAENETRDVDLLAVGSSVTWRNLDLTPFVTAGLFDQPLNAAPCFLHMHQTMFLTKFLLEHLNKVQAVIMVVAPRDFENCNETDRAFFSQRQAAPYLFRDWPPLYIYALNFRPIQIIRDALQVAERRSDPRAHEPLVMERFGSGPIKGHNNWNPAPTLDARCFAALGEFERMLSKRRIKLILVSFPLSPAWNELYDPSGHVESDFEASLRSRLKHKETIFISGRSFHADRSRYFDAIHFTWSNAQDFSAFIVKRLGGVMAQSDLRI